MIPFSGGKNVVKLRNLQLLEAVNLRCLSRRDCHVFVCLQTMRNFLFLVFSSNCLPHSALHESR